MLKLIKHEFIATYRNFLLIYVGIVALSIMAGLSNLISYQSIMFVIVYLAFVGLSIGGFVVLIVQSIKLYTSDLYAARGYLNLTLPVPTWKLLLAKILVMVIWYVITFLVFAFSYFTFLVLLALTSNMNFQIADIFNAIRYIFESIRLPWEVYSLWALNSFFSLFFTVTVVGFSATIVSTGWLKQGKWLVAVIIYFLLMYIIGMTQTFMVYLLNLNDNQTMLVYLVEHLDYNGLEFMTADFISRTWLSLCFNLVFGALAFFGTTWLIDHKIEIE